MKPPAPAIPLPAYQRAWVRDDSRFKIGMFARQTGKTFSTTLEIVDHCYRAAEDGRRSRWVILSRGERQAKEAIDEGVKRHARAYGLAVAEFERDFRAPDSDAVYRALEVELPGGSRITALPANPDTARGYSANVFLDEFALHRQSRAIWGSLFPVVSRGNLRLRVTSTPQGKGNKFYELMTSVSAGALWSRHVVDIHRAVGDGLDRDPAQLELGLSDDELWRQEYLLEWMDEASAWLPYDLIDRCEDDAVPARLALPRGDGETDEAWIGRIGDALRGLAERRGPAAASCVFGNDIARRGDLWTLWGADHDGRALRTAFLLELRDAPFAVQDGAMDHAHRLFRPYRIAMDQTGMGEKPVEDAKRRYGASVAEGVLLTAPRRLALASALKDRCEDGAFRIPRGDRALRADLHSIKRIAGATGGPRLLHDDDAASGSHADRFWAAALLAAAATGTREYGYQPAARGGARTRPDDPRADLPPGPWDAYAAPARFDAGAF